VSEKPKQEINALVKALQNGDESAFSKLYDMYSGALYGLILKIVLDEEIAQDVLQDSFVKIWKNCQSYSQEKGTFYTWMLNICRNTAIDSFRKTKKERENKIQKEADNVSSLNHESININTIGLMELIDKLPEEQRIVIDYLYFRGYTQQELSDELNIPLGTVKTRARNAVIELKDHFVLILLLWTLKNI
jgi:RNA polymerase sigma-70 factor (ECF subfamily)